MQNKVKICKIRGENKNQMNEVITAYFTNQGKGVLVPLQFTYIYRIPCKCVSVYIGYDLAVSSLTLQGTWVQYST